MMLRYVYRSHRPALLIFVGLLFLTGCPDGQVDLSPVPDGGGEHLVRLVHITDPQIVDEESPARAVRLAEFLRGAWRPQEAYGIHTLDATLQAVNRIHAEGGGAARPVDLVLVTGDLVDSAQVNELQWFLDTMDGKVVTADSGALDGVLRDVAPVLNPKLPYDAVGLDPSIPWYTCYGNHDGLAVGTFPIDRSAENADEWNAPLLFPVAALFGLHAAGPGNNRLVATDDWSPAILPGDIGAPFLDFLRLDLEALFPGTITADAERQFLSPRQFIAMHRASSSIPQGHGFNAAAEASGQAFYSVRPDPEVPLRLIVFDTVVASALPGESVFSGTLTQDHFRSFILPELEAAVEAGEWVILASHHPARDFDRNPSADTVGLWTFRGALATFPNVIMHINGHTHRHRTEIVSGPYPYLEVSTTSIIDYPQEGRILDVFIEEGGKAIRVESSIFSHNDAPTTFSAESFRRARIAAGVDGEKTAFDGHEKVSLEEGSVDHGFIYRLAR